MKTKENETSQSSPFFVFYSRDHDGNMEDLNAKNKSQVKVLTRAYSLSSFLVLSMYVAVWVFMYILIHHVMNEDDKKILGAPCIVMTVEIVKFIISVLIFCKEKKGKTKSYQRRFKELFAFLKSRACVKLALSYAPVALLYAVYNNLMLINLKSNYPTLYLILSSTRLLMMATIWQVVFRVEISPRKKMALVVIMLGYVARGLAEQDDNVKVLERRGSDMVFGSFLVLLQMACSVLASVYNEKLLKHHESEEQLQNICLYMNSIAINLMISVVATFTMRTDFRQPFFDASVFTPSMILVIFTLAMSGIITSFVLRYTNSLAKSVASATETSITYLIQVAFLQQGLEFHEALAVILVTCGAVIYATDKEPNKKNLDFDRDSSRRLKVIKERIINFAFRYVNTEKMRRAKTMHAIRSIPILMICTYLSVKSALILSTPITSKFQIVRHVSDVGNQTKHESSRESFCKESIAYERRWDNRTFTKDDIAMERQLRKIQKGQKILKYIVEQLSTVDAPVAIMYGTLLHELRKGEGDCIIPRTSDKDFDIAVFEQHFPLVAAMKDEIYERFGFEVYLKESNHLFLTIKPHGQAIGKGFQIDVYGFKCDVKNELIYLPWDHVALRMQDFLPLRRYKTVPLPENINVKKDALANFPSISIPYNPRCIVTSLYGPSYMTPMEKGAYSLNKQGFLAAKDYSVCQIESTTSSDIQEFFRQRSFCQREEVDALVDSASFWEKWRKDVKKKKKLIERKKQREITQAKHDSYHLDQTATAKKGKIRILTCVNNQGDVVNVIAAAKAVLQQRTTDEIQFEIYHRSFLSQYITAVLEKLSYAITVVDIGRSGVNSCLVDALRTTTMETAALGDIGDIRNFMDFLNTHNTITEALFFGKCTRSSEQKHVVLQTSFHLSKEVDTFLSSSDNICVHREVHNDLNDNSNENISISRVLSNGSTHHRNSSNPPTKINNFFFDAYRSILLNRPLKWVAFDGGLPSPIANDSREGIIASNHFLFNSLKNTKSFNRNSQKIRDEDVMVNVDLVLSADAVHVAMHNENSFGPYSFKGNSIPTTSPVSSMKFEEMKSDWRNPCLPNEIVKSYLVSNKYYFSDCDENHYSEPINRFEDFIDDNEFPALILDLKSSNATYDQGVHIFNILRESNTERNAVQTLEKIAMRYFSFDEKGVGRSFEVMPQYLYNRINKGLHQREVKVYVNSPSIEACTVIAHWMLDRNATAAGCFVQLNNVKSKESWRKYSKEILTSVSAEILSRNIHNRELRMICDIPSLQSRGGTSIWNDGLKECVENGFEWIHFPFSPPIGVDYSRPRSQKVGNIIVKENNIANALEQEKVFYGHFQEFASYTSHWGVTSPFYWDSSNQQWEFNGQNISQNLATSSDPLSIFRCVSKILTIMLFLRLEELGLMSIDDQVKSIESHFVTWRHIFTNTAGLDGSTAGKKFHYSNALWNHVEEFVKKLLGVSFIEAMNYYIINPMGLNGHFDIETIYPPFTARGFIGTNEDIMIIGSTLASHGVSPKTRLQIITEKSVTAMLKDWSVMQNVEDSFHKDETVASMRRFHHEGESTFEYGIVHGYSMGLWKVKGWRTEKETANPIEGWLAMGSSEALLYFDDDAIVVSMVAKQRVKGLELTGAFAKLVKSI